MPLKGRLGMETGALSAESIETMASIQAHHDYAVPPQPLWDLIVDFGNIEGWWPKGGGVRIDRVVLEGEGIGMTRHIYNEGMPAPVSERLDGLDPENWSWRLSIVGEKPAGIENYHATGRIVLTGDGASRIEYRGEFQARPGCEDTARQFLQAAYSLMFTGLEQATAAD
jgi:hypothetical protein